MKHKPCPFCGSTDLEFVSDVQYGHGDCGFTGWIECQECESRYARVGDWGTPSAEDEHEAWCKYDGKKRKFKAEDYEDEDESEEYKEQRRVFNEILKKYGGSLSLLDFLNLSNKDYGK